MKPIGPSQAIILVLLWVSLQGCAVVLVGGVAVGASVAHDRRTTGTIVEDESVELKAGQLLRNDKEISTQAHINVTSYNLVILLTGEAPTEAIRERAASLVRGVDKVTQVYNEIIIAAPSALSARSSDAWITTKAKSALFKVEGLKNQDFDPSRVKVVTEGGVVYLMGLVNRQEADAATEAVRRVGGVQRVVRLFQYVDAPAPGKPAATTTPLPPPPQ